MRKLLAVSVCAAFFAGVASAVVPPIACNLFFDGTNTIQIAWNAYPGESYVIQTTTNLAMPWQSGVPLVATTNSIYQAFSTANAARFFKVVKLDTDGPEVYQTSPINTGIGVALQSSIQAWLRDETGINTNSISLAVGTNAPVSLADPRLSYPAGVLTYTPGTNEFLGTNGQMVSVSLSAADTLGNQTTNFTWSFQLELAPVASPDIVFLGSGTVQSQKPNGPAPQGGGSGTPCNLALVSTNGDYFTFSYTGSCCLTNGTKLVNSNLYTGYARVVVSFTDYPASSTVVALTRPAKLAELLTAGTLSSVNLTLLSSQPMGPIRPLAALTAGIPLNYNENLAKVLYSDANFLVETLPASQLNLGASLDLKADFEWFKLTSIQATLAGDASFELDVHAHAGAAASFENSVPVIAPIHNVYGALIGPVPVWIDVVFTVNASYTANFSAAADVTNGISADKTISIGKKWTATAGATEIFTNLPPSLTLYGPLWQIQGSADLRVYLQPEVQVLVESLAGVSADLEPYLELEGNVQLNPYQWDLGLYAGLDSTVGLDLTVWDASWGVLPSITNHLIPQMTLWHQSGPSDAVPALQIVSQPQSQTVSSGATASFAVQVQGGGTPTYRWYKNGLYLTDDLKIIGSGSSTLRIGNVQSSDAASYKLRISGQGGPIDSSSAVLTLLAPPPVSPSPRLAWIPPGTFVMGSPTSEADRNTDETQHTVTLTKGFYMGKYQVTQGEYLALIGSNPSYFTTIDDHGDPISPDLSRPVESVSWYDATNYCGRLTQQEQAAGRLPSGWVYRLPTESEWEYACRAGTTTAFNFGNAIHGGMANFYDYYEYDASIGDIYVANPAVPWLPRTTTVGSYQPNAWGLYDMHGNVWEWCRDWYGTYPTGSVPDPTGAPMGSYRVIRGGSWSCNGWFCRSAQRLYWPGYRYDFIGFRVVLAPGQP